MNFTRPDQICHVRVEKLSPMTVLTIAMTIVAAGMLLMGVLGGNKPAEKELAVFTFEHEVGHNTAAHHDTAEEARQRAIAQTEADARAERASAELGVTVTPDTFSSAAEH